MCVCLGVCVCVCLGVCVCVCLGVCVCAQMYHGCAHTVMATVIVKEGNMFINCTRGHAPITEVPVKQMMG